jgi:bifunctional non-homologous end joining protein LigD
MGLTKRTKKKTVARKSATSSRASKRAVTKSDNKQTATAQKRATTKTPRNQKAITKAAIKTVNKIGKAVAKQVKKAAAQTPSSRSKAPSPITSLTEYRRKRDFTKTAEPAGTPRSKRTKQKESSLRFVIQKHAATQLHFDLRLELDGVMKSWAVPKGPSMDPTVKRLAMQVEDHPIEYNTFEGTIPKGEYGGGTVMLWDTGTYTPDTSAITTFIAEADSQSIEDIARHAYERGDFKVIFHGQRIRGSYVLVRTRGFRGSSSSKPSWLLIKHRDEQAQESPAKDLVDLYTTSVTTGRTMDEITQGAPPKKR